jgi:purine-binding chemotaxis protein CheW
MEQLDALSSQISFATDGNQYLTFTLGQEEYGVEILQVQEIKGYSAITPIPNTPPYIKGMMNLRGTIIPVLDLRAKFDLAATEYNQFTVIIVMRVGAKVMGVIVGAVSDVLNISTTDIQFSGHPSAVHEQWSLHTSIPSLSPRSGWLGQR